jgi:polar amino acid transport system ATP-binding protein
MKLEVSSLTKSYGPHTALRGLDLHVENARVLTLIGPSGGGKSTFLRLLGSLETPDSGSIAINRSLLGSSPQALMAQRRKNGFLFQQFNLFPHCSAQRNITLPLVKVHGLSPADAEARATEVLSRFGMAIHAQKLPHQLSGGQQQRVALARAFVSKPDVLFLDEPTSALDPEMTSEVLDLIQELAKDGQSIILSTHEMGFARAVSDHVAFIAEGKIVESGPPSAIFSQAETEICQRFLSKVMKY